MNEIVAGVNWIAVVVGAVLAFAVGALWYSPVLFQKPWLAGNGIAADDRSSVIGSMLLQAIGTFLLAWIIGVTAARDALSTAILIVLTLAALIAANGAFARKSSAAIVIESSYVIAMAVVMIAVQATL
jgi:hypothetical protein